MTQLNKTKAQLEELDFPFIGIEMKDGYKIYGHVTKFTKYTIYIKDRSGEITDVPRRIIERAFLLLKGDKKDESTKFFGKGKRRTPQAKY